MDELEILERKLEGVTKRQRKANRLFSYWRDRMNKAKLSWHTLRAQSIDPALEKAHRERLNEAANIAYSRHERCKELYLRWSDKLTSLTGESSRIQGKIREIRLKKKEKEKPRKQRRRRPIG